MREREKKGERERKEREREKLMEIFYQNRFINECARKEKAEIP